MNEHRTGYNPDLPEHDHQCAGCGDWEYDCQCLDSGASLTLCRDCEPAFQASYEQWLDTHGSMQDDRFLEQLWEAEQENWRGRHGV